MPRRRLLTPTERAALLAFPTTDDALIQTGDYSWHQNRLVEQGKFRPLRVLSAA
jgi:hypothetical protein